MTKATALEASRCDCLWQDSIVETAPAVLRCEALYRFELTRDGDCLGQGEAALVQCATDHHADDAVIETAGERGDIVHRRDAARRDQRHAAGAREFRHPGGVDAGLGAITRDVSDRYRRDTRRFEALDRLFDGQRAAFHPSFDG